MRCHMSHDFIYKDVHGRGEYNTSSELKCVIMHGDRRIIGSLIENIVPSVKSFKWPFENRWRFQINHGTLLNDQKYL